MILAAHSDASYLSESNARSRAGGHFFLSENDHYPTNNGAVLTISQIIKVVMSSAAEAELVRYISMPAKSFPCDTSFSKWATHNHPHRFKPTTLSPLAFAPKPWTCVSTGCVVVSTRNISGHTGAAGATNLADYVTKHHPAIHHQAATWDTSYSNELGRLCQGIGHHPVHKHKKRIDGTDTFKPIQYRDIPNQRKGDVTYTRVVCEIRPQKADPYRTRITLGGDRIRYPGDCGTKTGSLETVKLLLNSVLSTPTARFASFDISNFYLGTPLDRPEYARIKLSDIPDDFVQEYSLHDFAHNGYVYSKSPKASMASNKLAN
eukprot:CCRYP_016123-RA/>CCRYP_016123-RA protein AED:0.28 eAED:0.28 QI:0/0/0/1/0/0/3/0/318